MSKPKEDQSGNNPGDLIPGGNPPDSNSGGFTPGNHSGKNALAIEEHQKNLKVDAPVFAAVMQTEGWASGKKVPEAVFKKAVEDFLGAPMGGK
jgi:transcription elongation factor